MSEAKFLPFLQYIVGLSCAYDQTGLDKKNVEIVGLFENVQDAKHAVEANVALIMDDDKRALTIYKVNLENSKVYDFYRKDLKFAVEKALDTQKKENDVHLKLSHTSNNDPVKSNSSYSSLVLTAQEKDKKGTFPRPGKSYVGTLPDTAPLMPTTTRDTKQARLG